MKGRVMFWYRIRRQDDRILCESLFQLFGQQCSRCLDISQVRSICNHSINRYFNEYILFLLESRHSSRRCGIMKKSKTPCAICQQKWRKNITAGPKCSHRGVWDMGGRLITMTRADVKLVAKGFASLIEQRSDFLFHITCFNKNISF